MNHAIVFYKGASGRRKKIFAAKIRLLGDKKETTTQELKFLATVYIYTENLISEVEQKELQSLAEALSMNLTAYYSYCRICSGTFPFSCLQS